jgi:hypothetical protein
MTEELSSWRDGPAKQAIIDFVARTCGKDRSTATSPPAAVVTSCGPSARTCTASPRASHRKQQHLRLHQRRPWRHHHPQARGRLPRRRPGRAGPDLEPSPRTPAARSEKL